ncbi:MAG: thymidine phosphorylase [Myxococcota bacterium]
MRSIVEVIAAKRDGAVLSEEEIRWVIAEFAADRLPVYQMSALAMAIFFRGMTPAETGIWTDAMLRSGLVLDLSALGSGRVDKHSTGGVGDKISLPLAPAAAACDVIVPMVSGRGLGHTGGTLDKLESIPGFTVDISVARFREILSEVGCAMIGQTADIAPADKRLYALRDVTATVESIPLITSSIMSKKLAEGIEGLVLDVKVGRAAFMKTVDDARRLAEAMVAVGEQMGKRVVAYLTRMEEPLGQMVGNACEVRESVDVLRGGGPKAIVELVETLGGAMVELAHGVDHAEGARRIRTALQDGSAHARWERMVAAQGGRIDGLPEPTGETPILAPSDGFIGQIDGLEVGLCGVALGAGRVRSDQAVDPIVGVRVDAPVGTEVKRGQSVATILHGASGAPHSTLVERLGAAFSVVDHPPVSEPLILERID